MDLQAFYAGDIVPCYRLRKLIVDRNHKYRRKIDRSRTLDFAGISLRKCLLWSMRSVFRRLSCLELKGP